MKAIIAILYVTACVLSMTAAQQEVESEPMLRSRVQDASEFLHSSMPDMQSLAVDMREDLQGDFKGPGRRSLFFRDLDAYCARVEDALNNEFNCGCRFLWVVLAYEFRCYAKDDMSTKIGEYEGRAKYQGLLDLNPFKFSVDLKAKVCIDKATYKGDPAQTLCVAGVFCVGVPIEDNLGFCGCKAEYGNIGCTCEDCEGGISVGCQGFTLPLCVPLPIVA